MVSGTLTAFGQCPNAPSLSFHSPVLISGTDKQIGAVYKFADVAPGLDAQIQITDLVGGATLFNIDDSTGVGYYPAFQPYVGAGANDTSYLDWRITFKVGGTNTDTMLACLAVTGVDVDGDGSRLKEFIEAATPGSFSVDPYTNLSVSFDGVRSKAISPVANIPLIDTAHHEAMFQMNFTNITTLDYRNGAISTYGSPQVRQTCIYFKPFFSSYFLLPTRLLSFAAKSTGQTVDLNWSAADETNLSMYVVQRSEDGRTWSRIARVPVSGTGSVGNYRLSDLSDINGPVYYRLMMLLQNGNASYSPVVKVTAPAVARDPSFFHSTVFSHSVDLRITSADDLGCVIQLYSLGGSVVARRAVLLHGGSNPAVLDVPASAPPGVYLLSVRNSTGRELHHAKLVKTN